MQNYDVEKERKYRKEKYKCQEKLICPFLSTPDEIIYCQTEDCACFDDEHIECSIMSICRNFNGEYDD